MTDKEMNDKSIKQVIMTFGGNYYRNNYMLNFKIGETDFLLVDLDRSFDNPPFYELAMDKKAFKEMIEKMYVHLKNEQENN